MPWSKEAESENRFHRAVLVALLICFVFISFIPQIIVPIPDPSVDVVKIPERLVKLVKKEPIPRPRPEQQKPDKPAKGKEPAPAPSKIAADKVQKAATARKKAERAGVLAFKGAFVDLLDETPVAKLGAEARLSD